MPMEHLEDLLLDQLKDLYSAEKQLVSALPRLAKKAVTPDLRTAIETHLEETQGHVDRLEQAFDLLGQAARAKTCKGMQALIEEGKEILDEDGEDAIIDAGIIGAAQKVEHYEMAAYGTVAAFARRLGNEELAELLEATLEEEKAADEKLNEIAEESVNPAAASAGNGAGEEEGGEEEGQQQGARRRSPSRSGGAKRKSR